MVYVLIEDRRKDATFFGGGWWTRRRSGGQGGGSVMMEASLGPLLPGLYLLPSLGFDDDLENLSFNVFSSSAVYSNALPLKQIAFVNFFFSSSSLGASV